ncbi:MAG TPA: tetratricopeptide repeat protein [Candidatus Dormibacteraeota bacterium]|nr:tetratricopeptide repeat protein [Candidatus Dormibacteraeota bacterium]
MPLEAPAQPGPLPNGSRITLAPTPLFGGRGPDLRRLATTLKSSRVIVLTGPDGVGKTLLAAEFAHRYGSYFAGGVFWLSFGLPEDVSMQVAACGGAGALELRADFAELALDDQLHLVLRAWQEETPRLLVFDDCDDEGLLSEWLPAAGGAHVLVTSRRSSWDGALRLTTIPLAPLDRGESVALLRRFRPDIDEATPALRHVAAELEDLPLALRLAGGILRRYRGAVALDAFLDQLRSREVLEQAAALLGETEPPPTRPTGSRALFARRRPNQSSPVARAFALAHRWLERSDPMGRPALAVLARAACFAAGEPIPRHVLLAAAADTRSAESLIRLLDLGLLEAAGDGVVRVHRVVADLVRTAFQDPTAQAAVEEAMIAWARAANDAGEAQSRLLAVPHLDVATRTALEQPSDGERTAALCFELGRSLWAAGDLRRSRAQLERTLEIHEQLLGPQDHRTIATLSALGSLLQAQGDLAGAQSVLERALEHAQVTLGPDHPDTAVILTNLAWTLRFQGDLAGARGHLERALTVSERTLGPDHPETVGRLDGLGVLLREQGDLPAARGYAERAMDSLERTLGPDHPRTVVAINNVGLLLREQGELRAARVCLEHALRVSEHTLGLDHPDTATALDNMGTLLQAEGNLDEARLHIERALAIRERSLGPDNPATGTSYNNLGMLIRQQGDAVGARPYLEQALIVSQRVLGPYDPQTATSYNNVGTLLLELGDLYGAQPHLERALAIREQGLGADHPDTATSLANVAALQIAYGDLAGARTPLERTLEIRETVLGAEHPLTADTLHRLGGLLRQLGDAAGARRALERAVAIREQVLGPDHPDTLASMTAHDELVRELGGRRSAWPPRKLPEAEFFEEQ